MPYLAIFAAFTAVAIPASALEAVARVESFNEFAPAWLTELSNCICEVPVWLFMAQPQVSAVVEPAAVPSIHRAVVVVAAVKEGALSKSPLKIKF